MKLRQGLKPRAVLSHQRGPKGPLFHKGCSSTIFEVRYAIETVPAGYLAGQPRARH